MFSSRHSPLKRKYSEYHDPDYPQQQQQIEEDDGGKPGCSAQFANKRKKPECEIKAELQSKGEKYFEKVRQVIEREFHKEIVMKQQQLEEIDERLEKAKRLLDRLRYGIVSAYYKKQEIPLTASDAATLKNTNSLFEREDRGPQMAIHPSIKKLIGKKPKDLSDVIRSCPKRTAAQNAVQTIRAKSQIQKREERKLKQIIRQQGIVIDHSKQDTTEKDVNSLLHEAAQNSLRGVQEEANVSAKPESKEAPTSGKSLNAARLNNKVKHFIVVGNTSKYIGNEVDIKPNAQNLTHKWLVYVQLKDSKQPIERFIKKVRFHLHHSYRPNDMVDIEAPPFQVSRRGWGEFPIRVQLFFQPEFHQKPVQLIHNIILDQTYSGIQTLGAETLLEIWLRQIKSANPTNKEIKQETEIMKKPEIPTKYKSNLMSRGEELVDDNLLDFLNKIETSHCSISADIEKIQPTVVVTEPLGVKLTKTPSPEKCKILPSHAIERSPIKMPPLVETSRIPEKSLALISTIISNTTEVAKISEKSLAITSTATSQITTVPMPALTSVSASPGSQFKTPIFTNGSLTSKPMTTFVRLSASSAPIKFINTTTNAAVNIPPLRPLTPTPAPLLTSIQTSLATTTTVTTSTQKPSIILNKDGKILMPSASVASTVRRTTLPIVSGALTTIANSTSQASQLSSAKRPQLVAIPPASSAATPSSRALITQPASPKQILQKKLVQLVDSTGKVKYIQMLVAASSASSSLPNMSTSSVAPKLTTMAPSSAKNNTVTSTTQITKTVSTPLLRAPNGAHLMPAMTMKPNIFKIVPESMQTKPQILTFSTTTVVATTTNTFTTAQTAVISTTRAVGQLMAASPESITTTTTINNVALPIAKKLPKTNGNNTTTALTKNLVFQKEGKVYIIDPQQMKYKQQQKKQVSLLKPQISLLKQQQQQRQKLTTTPTQSSAVEANTTAPVQSMHNNSNNNNNNNSPIVPPLHFGLKQQRLNTINALQLQQMKRVLFEKQFLRQDFINIRSAVEFLLRRLKLVVSKDSLVSAFPFVSYSLQEFHSLTAFKQRACEWLRAKNISRLLRQHKTMQRLNSSSKETFWSTKEIATFAREYAYTPPIKCLPRPGESAQTDEDKSKDFTALVKSELKQEHNLQYDTLSDHRNVSKWVDKVWHTLEDYEHHEDQHQIVDIEGIAEEEEEDKKTKRNANTNNNITTHLSSSSLDSYLAPPPHLENQCQLVSGICKDLNIKLAPEELDSKLYHPSTQTVLAQCLHLFIEKLLRQSIALKQDKTTTPSLTDTICTILPQDLAKVLASNHEFDFLTNSNFGSALTAEGLETSIKQEKP